MIDTHCHLNDSAYENYNEILKNFYNEGGETLICIGCDEQSNAKARQISIINSVYYSVGIHPEYADKFNVSKMIYELKNRTDKLVAIGEIGLDYHYVGFDKNLQIEAFKKQIELAKEYDLPIIVHCRDAYEDCLEVLKSFLPIKKGGVIHCFSADIEFAKKVIEMGFKISFTGNITFKNNDNLREIIKEIDLSNILAETDSPYMSPVPFRGQRNEPKNVLKIIEKISEIKGLDFDTCDKILSNNAKKLFNLK